MSIRSTNVYEEKSLGVWQDDEEGEEPQYQGHQAVAKYLGWQYVLQARLRLSGTIH
jgi:hypothetical protein